MHLCRGWGVNWTQKISVLFPVRKLFVLGTYVSWATGLHGSLLILVTQEFIIWIWSNRLGDMVLLIISNPSFLVIENILK